MRTKLNRLILNSELIWLHLAAFFVLVPTNFIVGFSTAVALEPSSKDLPRITLAIFLPPLIIAPVIGWVSIYPFEKYVVRDKALTSLTWVFIRTAFFMLCTVPMAFVLVEISNRFFPFVPQPARLIEVYLPSALAEGFMYSIAFAFFEYVFTEFAKREASLTQQLQELRMEIDVIKKEKAVAEITDSDEFMTLKARAQELRNKNSPD